SHPMHSAAVRAIDLLLNDEVVAVIPQSFIEFWGVATRPEVSNGLGLTVEEVVARLRFIKSTFKLLPDVDGIFEEWERLVVQHQVLGKPVYNARIVAAMTVHGLTHLLTLNTNDFKRFTN